MIPLHPIPSLSYLFDSLVHTSRDILPLISGFVPWGERRTLARLRLNLSFCTPSFLWEPLRHLEMMCRGQLAHAVTRLARSHCMWKRRRKGSVDDEMKGNCHFNKHVARYRGSETTGNTTTLGLLPHEEKKNHPPKYANVFSWLTAQLTARYTAEHPPPNVFQNPFSLFLPLGHPDIFSPPLKILLCGAQRQRALASQKWK